MDTAAVKTDLVDNYEEVEMEISSQGASSEDGKSCLFFYYFFLSIQLMLYML